MTEETKHPGHIYILRLEDDCWYVGHTIHLKKRMWHHFTKEKRTHWTGKHKPVALQMAVQAPIELEGIITVELARLVGDDKVRGGWSLVMPELAKSTERQLIKMFRQPALIGLQITHSGYGDPTLLDLSETTHLRP